MNEHTWEVAPELRAWVEATLAPAARAPVQGGREGRAHPSPPITKEDR